MPNWCNNEITIEGSKEAIDGIMKIILDGNPNSFICKHEMIWRNENGDAERHPRLFDVLMPEPDGYESKMGWARDKWGTKWDADNVCLTCYDETINISCQTAWSPPDGVYQHLIENHEVFISAQYEEPGMQFLGEWRGEWEEGGTGAGGYREWEWNLQNRTILRGEVPEDYVRIGKEVVGDLLYYTSEDTIKDGEPMRQVLGLMKGNGWIDKFGDVYEDLEIDIECCYGDFYIAYWELEDVDAWMQNAITEEEE